MPSQPVFDYITLLIELQNIFDIAINGVASGDLAKVRASLSTLLVSISDPMSIRLLKVPYASDLVNQTTELQVFRNRSVLPGNSTAQYINDLIKMIIYASVPNDTYSQFIYAVLNLNTICKQVTPNSSNSAITLTKQMNTSLLQNLDRVMQTESTLNGLIMSLAEIYTTFAAYIRNQNSFVDASAQMIYNSRIVGVQSMISTLTQGPGPIPSPAIINLVDDKLNLRYASICIDLIMEFASTIPSDSYQVNTVLTGMIASINNNSASLQQVSPSTLIDILVANRTFATKYSTNTTYIAQDIGSKLSQLETQSIQQISGGSRDKQELMAKLIDMSIWIQSQNSSEDQILIEAQGILAKFGSLGNIIANQATTSYVLQQVNTVLSNLSAYSTTTDKMRLLAQALSQLQSSLIAYSLPSYTPFEFITCITNIVNDSGLTNNANPEYLALLQKVRTSIYDLLNIGNRTIARIIGPFALSNIVSAKGIEPTSTYVNNQRVRDLTTKFTNIMMDMLAQAGTDLYGLVQLILDMLLAVAGANINDQPFTEYTNELKNLASLVINLNAASVGPIMTDLYKAQAAASDYIKLQDQANLLSLQSATSKLKTITAGVDRVAAPAKNLSTSISSLKQVVDDIFQELLNQSSQINAGGDSVKVQKFAFTIVTVYSSLSTLSLSSFKQDGSTLNEPFASYHITFTQMKSIDQLILTYRDNIPSQSLANLNMLRNMICIIKASNQNVNGNLYTIMRACSLISYDNLRIQQASLGTTIDQIMMNLENIPERRLHAVSNSLADLQSVTSLPLTNNILDSIQSLLLAVQASLIEPVAKTYVTVSTNANTNTPSNTSGQTITFVKPNPNNQLVVIVSIGVVLALVLIGKIIFRV